MKVSSTVGIALSAAVVCASIAAAQPPARRAPGTPPGGDVAVVIALQAGSDAVRFDGQATCTHEPRASIYEVPAQQWRVEHHEGSRGVTLTFWRPASGSGDMFTLHVQGSGASYAASTVKTKGGGSPKGSGAVSFAPAGAGGTFTVNATAANGAKVTGTIKCAAFRALVAEGGN